MIPVLAAAAAVLLILIAVMMGALTGDLASTGNELCTQQQTPADQNAADIPDSYLKLYAEAGNTYKIPWQILAAVGSIESDHGRSRIPGIRSGENHAGAGGPMQFLSGTWKAFGVDGNDDGAKDRYAPADAIPAAARYLRHNGAPQRMRSALFAYNRSTDYVDQVLAKARSYARGQDPQALAQAAAECELLDATAELAGVDETVQKIIAFALAQRGKRYVLGANGPDAWDCSSLVQAAYRHAGVSIPRTTFEQWPFGTKIRKGTEQPGDLVFFNSGPGSSADNPGHVGMVVNPRKGTMIVARCPTCRPNIGVQSYKDRKDWIGSTRPLLRLTQN